jgi:hypothetical protein
MTKTTHLFKTIGQAILSKHQNAALMSQSGVKHLHGTSPGPDWQDIPAERDAFVQYEPPTRTLTAKLGDLALYRHLTQRSSQTDVLAVLDWAGLAADV